MNLEKIHSMDIILLAGLYGSGKTEFASQYFSGRGRNRISRSEIRKSIHDMSNFGEKWDAKNFNETDDTLVKHIERKIIEHYIHNKRKILLINTFVTKKSRKTYIESAKASKRSIGIVYLNSPLRTCIEQNERFGKGVPTTVINTLYPRVELPEKSEGFNEIEIITNFTI